MKVARAACNNVSAYDVENAACENKSISPARSVKALRDLLLQYTARVIDFGAHMMFVFHHWLVTDPTQVIIIVLDYMGTMGWAWGAVIGSKVALPNCPYVLFNGDTCLCMEWKLKQQLNMIY